MAYLMGVDLGTSSVKAMLMDEDGREVALAGRKYDISIPQPYWAEQEPEMWWRESAAAMSAALAEAEIASSAIRAVSFSGQMHGLVCMGADGKPVRPAIIWQDQRTVEAIREIHAILSPDFLAGRTLNALSAGFLLASLYWLKHNEPENYDRTETVLLPKDYIKYRLSGVLATDYSDAAASLAFDNHNQRWAEEILLLLDLEPDKLPPIRPSTDRIGSVLAEAAEQTGLSTSTLVINGGADQAMQAIGNGIVEDGVLCANIGTGGQVSTAIREPLFDQKLRTNTFAHALPGRWYIMGATLAAGASLKWLSENVLHTDDFITLDAGAETIGPGSGGVVFLPYLGGERTPHLDPLARAAFFGMTLGHTRFHLARAVMEGVAFSFRDCLDILTGLEIPCRKLIASGGGAVSYVWMQILADVLQKDVHRSLIREQACLGAAITAGVGAGMYKSYESACARLVQLSDDPIRPVERNVKMYEQLVCVYRGLYQNTRESLHTLSNMF